MENIDLKANKSYNMVRMNYFLAGDYTKEVNKYSSQTIFLSKRNILGGKQSG